MLVAFLAILSTFTVTTAMARNSQPNFVLFISDDHTATDCGAYGSREVRTPNIDRLAREGMLFRRAFAASPTCMPSRASLFTGLMPFRNGAHANNLGSQSQCREDVRSLPYYLNQLGYRVAQAGKTHFAPKSVFPFERITNSEVPEPGFENHRDLHMDLNTSVVDEWLQNISTNKPFCLVVCDHSPHVVWLAKTTYDPETITVPPNQIDTPDVRKSRARYYTDISKMDTNLGSVLASLEKLGLGANTIFIYTSDQGAQWPFSKWGLYDQGIQVPFIVRWPGKIRPGSSSDAMISMVDVLPTFMEIANSKPPLDLDGKSFLPVLEGKTNRHRDVIFATHSQDTGMNSTPMRCIRTARYKYIFNLSPEIEYTTHMDKAKDHDGGREYWDSWVKAAAADPRAAAIMKRYHWRPREELYDVLLDPYEVNNLADNPAYADIKTDLNRQLTAWRKQQNDSKTGPDPAPVKK
ncbi:sulfatase [Pedosphaera parvula Ellin514]|uniref:Sulfatase n=1 Tax=Pedosphaera parvula (strain Ellin514) TaxID=320771 RepID=B9XR96_PEDPL|nr:sulfatase [Pedosphaera parvula Ellin514]